MPMTSGTYSNNESQIYQILRSNGFNIAQTCGILANIEDECNYNPTALNSKEGAYGLCQWRDNRKTSLFSKYTNKPSVFNQVRHIIDELNGEDSIAKGCLNGIAETRSGAYDAAYAFASKFERCDSSHRVPRASRAQYYWDYYFEGKGIGLKPVDSLKVPETPESASTSVPTYGSQVTVGNIDHIVNNLSKVTVSGYQYGHLIDMTRGGEFRFYIPEFKESAGAQWEDISIPGRSVSIKSYNYTNSRKVTIDLDLYAGVGLYSGDSNSDVVGALHADANFVKSLEYPDYSIGVAQPPSSVHLILGEAFNMVGVVSDVNVDHLKPLDSQNRSMYIKLSFTVTQNVSDPPSWSDIRSGITAVSTSVNSPARLDNTISGSYTADNSNKIIVGNLTGHNGMPSNVPGGGTYYKQ